MNSNLKKLLLCAAGLFTATLCAAQKPADWANFGRFEADNAALTAAPKVVLMGNSITEGWFNQHPDFFRRNNFAGRGIGGQTSSEMLVRFRQDVINLHPEVVAILSGTNDIAMNNGYIALENTFQNIVSMCELARFNNIKVLLCSVTPATGFGWRPQVDPRPLIPQLNKMLREYAEATDGVEWVDYFSAMAGADNGMREGLSPEGCHPNGEGYKIMERVLVKALKRLTGSDRDYFVYE